MRLQHRLGLQVKRALSEQPPRHANCLGQAVQVLGGRQERGCAASPRVAPRPTRYASEGGNPVYEDAEQAQLVLRGLQVKGAFQVRVVARSRRRTAACTMEASLNSSACSRLAGTQQVPVFWSWIMLTTCPFEKQPTKLATAFSSMKPEELVLVTCVFVNHRGGSTKQDTGTVSS